MMCNALRTAAEILGRLESDVSSTSLLFIQILTLVTGAFKAVQSGMLRLAVFCLTAVASAVLVRHL